MSKFKNVLFLVLLFVFVGAMWSVMNMTAEVDTYGYSDLVKDINSDIQTVENGGKAKIQSMTFFDDYTAEIKIKDGNSVKLHSVDVPGSIDRLTAAVGNDGMNELIENGLAVNVKHDSDSWFISIIPSLVMVILFVSLMFFMFRQTQGGGGKMMSFGKAKTRAANIRHKVTFKDVAGADEEKEELAEVVDFLKNPQKFTELGARIPKGILLVGPPGTGKTLLAKAVAGEAGVPFFSISGSDFVEMFVGVGASRVRDLFDQAKKNLPAIVFIDEIDAVGRQRGAGLGGGHDEREQTLNQLLVEMDGFEINEGVIIIAATNRPDILDPALLRPGRFDRQVVVGAPDVKGREEILKVHSKGKFLGDDVDLSVVAKTTIGFTGADLENLLNEAALLSARENKKVINMPELKEAMLKVTMGPEKKSRVVSEADRKNTAYHEAGHALAAYFLPKVDNVHQISIIPRGRAGGYTMTLPKDDQLYKTREELIENIVMTMGGRAAEEIIFGDYSTGASGDIQQATKLARDMVTKYGMSKKLGTVAYVTHEEVFMGRDFGSTKPYSEEFAAEIDKEVRSIIDECHDRCTEILKSHIDKLHEVTNALIEREALTGEEFAEIMEAKPETENHGQEKTEE